MNRDDLQRLIDADGARILACLEACDGHPDPVLQREEIDDEVNRLRKHIAEQNKKIEELELFIKLQKLKERTKDQVMPEPGKDYICSSCCDTHQVHFDDKSQMCTRCPTPCLKCATSNGRGAYCKKTPCSCSCHKF